MSGYDIDYFQQINLEEAPQAERLADVLVWHYQPQSVLDIGCASGLYLKPFLARGIKVTGVDNAKLATDKDVLQIPRQFVKVRDITKQPLRLHVDLTLCIEVMEHIEGQFAEKCTQHIAQTSDLIFFTAGQPGQGGVGHVNCQPKKYWQELFAKLGFERDFHDEDYIRLIMQNGYHMGWLTNNLMIFKKSV